MTTAKRGEAVEFAYLEAFVGDRTVAAEVLGMFQVQALGWAAELASPAAGWRDTVHTIKGTSRGVGAFAVGDACEAAEAEGEGKLPRLVAALEAAAGEIATYLAGAS